MVLCPYWANIRRWIPQVSLLLPKETALRHFVLLWCNLVKEGPCFRPRCCHLTEGRALYCTWLNSSTDIVNTAQCASSSLTRLPRNLKIAFTFWFTLVQLVAAVTNAVFLPVGLNIKFRVSLLCAGVHDWCVGDLKRIFHLKSVPQYSAVELLVGLIRINNWNMIWGNYVSCKTCRFP